METMIAKQFFYIGTHYPIFNQGEFLPQGFHWQFGNIPIHKNPHFTNPKCVSNFLVDCKWMAMDPRLVLYLIPFLFGKRFT